VSALSSSVQDYLKVILTLSEWSDAPVSVKQIADQLSLRTSSVSEALRKLADAGLVHHEPYGGISLTAEGRQHAIAMVRRHRLIETFLVNTLGYSWDEVHEEAEILEHAVSDGLVERIDKHLGYPERDPHGDPIPTRDGADRRQKAELLADAEAGARLRVSRISDADPQMLRYFAEIGLLPGVSVRVVEHRRFAGVSTVQIDGRDGGVDLGVLALSAIWVESAPA